MLRGLAIRQLFVGIDLLLAVGISTCAGVVALKVLRGAEAAVVPSQDIEVDKAQYAAYFTPPGPRSDYNRIISSRLFGNAAATSKADPPPVKAPETVVQAEVVTKLPLRLIGTLVHWGNGGGTGDTHAAAIIESREGQPLERTFFTGNEVLSNVFLLEVQSKRVRLDNRRTNQQEWLNLTDDPTPPPAPAVARTPARTQVATAQPQNLVELDKAAVSQKLLDSYTEIAETVDVRLYEENGEVKGLTASRIEHIELARELGLKDNDVLTSINNQPIKSVEDVENVLQKYGNANNFRLGVIRGGQTMYLQYRLK